MLNDRHARVASEIGRAGTGHAGAVGARNAEHVEAVVGAEVRTLRAWSITLEPTLRVPDQGRDERVGLARSDPQVHRGVAAAGSVERQVEEVLHEASIIENLPQIWFAEVRFQLTLKS